MESSPKVQQIVVYNTKRLTQTLSTGQERSDAGLIKFVRQQSYSIKFTRIHWKAKFTCHLRNDDIRSDDLRYRREFEIRNRFIETLLELVVAKWNTLRRTKIAWRRGAQYHCDQGNGFTVRLITPVAPLRASE